MATNQKTPSLKALVPWVAWAPSIDRRKIMYDGTTGDIYHMLQWDHALTIFKERRLRLSPVRDWPDGYERWWCQQLFHEGSELRNVQAYAQCWTTGRYDEPRWRMAGFGRPEPIVRIRCTIRSILEAGNELIKEHPSASLYLGRVKYCPMRRLEQLAQLAQSAKQVGRTAATMLLHKRNAFEFESEVRLLWLDREAGKEAAYVPIDPLTAISQVMSSPHAKPTEHKKIRAAFREVGINVIRSLALAGPTPLLSRP